MAKRQKNEDWLNVARPTARRMIDAAREMRGRPTAGEELLWSELRARKLDGRKFRRQQPIGTFIVDFYCAEVSLAVEVDGAIHAGKATEDADRRQRIEATGVRFLRISDELVRTDMPAALEQIRITLAAHAGEERHGRNLQSPPLRSSERGPGGEE